MRGQNPAARVPVLSSEVAGADLGDARLSQRLGLLIDSIADRSAESFPKALDDASLEAAYRFFGNASVTPGAILAPHFRQTAQRAATRRDVLVIHDTTQFEFGGDTKREGLGRLIRPGQGFFGHFALATSADGDREPLGLLNLETVFRLDKVSSKPRPQRPNRGESARWRSSIDAAEAVLDGQVRAIHGWIARQIRTQSCPLSTSPSVHMSSARFRTACWPMKRVASAPPPKRRSERLLARCRYRGVR